MTLEKRPSLRRVLRPESVAAPRRPAVSAPEAGAGFLLFRARPHDPGATPREAVAARRVRPSHA